MEASFARSVLVDAPMAIVAVDASGAVRSFNPAAGTLFGPALTLRPPVGIETLIEGLVLPTSMDEAALARFNARQPGAGAGRGGRVRRARGGPGFVDVHASAFSFRGEDLLTLFLSEVTAPASAGTTTGDLQQQIVRNGRLNAMGEIASMLAHELNQPLSAVANFLDAARTLASRESPDHAKVVHFISSAELQARRAGEVIRRLRALLAGDTGFQAPEVVAEAVAELLPVLDIVAREIDVEIVVDVPARLVARCDRVQLQQVLLNLVRNAVDAPATDHRRRIVITASAIDRGVRMTVEDNGPGIAPGIRERLFAPLASSSPSGMGLGLSICRTLIEAHGGQIDVVPGTLGGAAFAFTLIDTDGHVPG